MKPSTELVFLFMIYQELFRVSLEKSSKNALCWGCTNSRLFTQLPKCEMKNWGLQFKTNICRVPLFAAMTQQITIFSFFFSTNLKRSKNRFLSQKYCM
jgi:hypothetical protein